MTTNNQTTERKILQNMETLATILDNVNPARKKDILRMYAIKGAQAALDYAALDTKSWADSMPEDSMPIVRGTPVEETVELDMGDFLAEVEVKPAFNETEINWFKSKPNGTDTTFNAQEAGRFTKEATSAYVPAPKRRVGFIGAVLATGIAVLANCYDGISKFATDAQPTKTGIEQSVDVITPAAPAKKYTGRSAGRTDIPTENVAEYGTCSAAPVKTKKTGLLSRVFGAKSAEDAKRTPKSETIDAFVGSRKLETSSVRDTTLKGAKIEYVPTHENPEPTHVCGSEVAYQWGQDTRLRGGQPTQRTRYESVARSQNNCYSPKAPEQPIVRLQFGNDTRFRGGQPNQQTRYGRN